MIETIIGTSLVRSALVLKCMQAVQTKRKSETVSFRIDSDICSVLQDESKKGKGQPQHPRWSNIMEQTIPTLVESTGLSFKTAQRAVLKLNELGLVKRSRKIGNTQTYRFDASNDLHALISWAEKVKVNRIRD